MGLLRPHGLGLLLRFHCRTQGKGRGSAIPRDVAAAPGVVRGLGRGDADHVMAAAAPPWEGGGGGSIRGGGVLEGGGGSGTQKCVTQKWPNPIFPLVNLVSSHDGHFGLEGLLLRCTGILILPPGGGGGVATSWVDTRAPPSTAPRTLGPETLTRCGDPVLLRTPPTGRKSGGGRGLVGPEDSAQTVGTLLSNWKKIGGSPAPAD